MIEVTAAIIFIENKVLCLKRGHSKYSYISNKYEFPGGKIKVNETPIDALIREIREELEMEISIRNYFLKVDHIYPDFSLINFLNCVFSNFK